MRAVNIAVVFGVFANCALQGYLVYMACKYMNVIATKIIDSCEVDSDDKT